MTAVWLSTMWLIAPLAVAAAIAASTAGGVTERTDALHRCGTVTAGGASWQVSASSSIPCTKARSIVQRLGARPTPPRTLPYYSGVYLGMRCLGAKQNGRRLIDCGGTGGRAVNAVA
ncbi:MAG TPA: hypothetical protein VFB25_11800 [Gaiellaceae bacterium]|nr:hypothetical protein [Gaiellaceae bacterium]